MQRLQLTGQSLITASEATVPLVGTTGPLNKVDVNSIILTSPVVIHPATVLEINNSTRIPLFPHVEISIEEPITQLDMIMPDNVDNLSGDMTEINIAGLEFVLWDSCKESFIPRFTPRQLTTRLRWSLSGNPSIRLRNWDLSGLVMRMYGTSTYQGSFIIRDYDINQGVESGREWYLSHSRSTIGGKESIEIETPLQSVDITTFESNGTPGSSHYMELILSRK